MAARTLAGMKILCLLLPALALAARGHAQALPDSTAIKQVLEKESATWRAGDVAGHAQCWVVRPYSRILVSLADGTVLDVPPATMLHPPAGAMGKGGTAVNMHYRLHIAGDNAWVSHDEVSTASDGQQTYSAEFRMLEKVRGAWKLVGQSIHIRPQAQ